MGALSLGVWVLPCVFSRESIFIHQFQAVHNNFRGMDASLYTAELQ